MKKFFSLFLFLGVIGLLTACNGIEERLNFITITFETNNEMTLHPLIYERGESVELPNLSSTQDHDFMGWFFDEALTLPATDLSEQEVSFTLYAKWERIVEEVITYGILLDVYTQIVPVDIYMNDDALFIIDDLGDLYIKPNDGELLKIGDFVDPDDDGDNIIFTWSRSAFIMTSDGTIYAWGENIHGELGTGNKERCTDLCDITSQFSLDEDESIVRIVGNEKTTFALTSSGNLYAWGDNSNRLITDGDSDELSPRNVKDFWCGKTDHFLVDNGLCGDTEHLIIDVGVTEDNVIVLTNQHQLFVWGSSIHEWFTEFEVMSEDISEQVYSYLTSHVSHIETSNNTVIIVSDKGELLILGTSRLSTNGKDDGMRPNLVRIQDYLDVDDDGDGIPTMFVSINNGTIYMRSNDDLWCWGNNELRSCSSKDTEFINHPQRMITQFKAKQLVSSNQEACALDQDSELWCWGSSSSRSYSRENELILSTEYRYIEYRGDETNWTGELEDASALRSSVGPIRWMVPERLVAPEFARSSRIYGVVRYHVAGIPPSIHGIEVANDLSLRVCHTDNNDCNDLDPDIHPDSYRNSKASNGVIQWTLEVRVDRIELA